MSSTTARPSEAVLDLVKDLIARPSVTPADEDCQAALAARLERIGFTCETIAQGGVTNLWARGGRPPPGAARAGTGLARCTVSSVSWSSSSKPLLRPSFRPDTAPSRATAKRT
ncbi:hypothetical protein G6F68_016871 [Rhizopus microsporus]|nr:hypothetical protein G6F68_016871 [Rhizopus microsporus]